jgi:hypothetical protein
MQAWQATTEMGRATYPRGYQDKVVPPQAAAVQKLAVDAQGQEEDAEGDLYPHERDDLGAPGVLGMWHHGIRKRTVGAGARHGAGSARKSPAFGGLVFVKPVRKMLGRQPVNGGWRQLTIKDQYQPAEPVGRKSAATQKMVPKWGYIWGRE